MSRIGRMPVAIPAGVTVEIVNNYVTVKGRREHLRDSFRLKWKLSRKTVM